MKVLDWIGWKIEDFGYHAALQSVKGLACVPAQADGCGCRAGFLLRQCSERFFGGSFMNIKAANSLLIQIENMERQLSIMKRQVKNLVAAEASSTHSFADLKGILKGKISSSEEDIDAVRYRLTPEFEEEITTRPEAKTV